MNVLLLLKCIFTTNYRYFYNKNIVRYVQNTKKI